MPRPDTELRKQPRQERSRALVDALLEATRQLMVEEGLEAVTTARVAERAGASIGSLYQYFPGREALLAAVIDRKLESDLQELRPVIEQLRAAPLADAIAGLVEVAVRYYRDETPLYREMIAAMSQVDREAHVARSLEGFDRAIAWVLEPHGSSLGPEVDLPLAAWTMRSSWIACVREAAATRSELLQDGRLAAQLEALARGVLGLSRRDSPS